MKDTVTYTCWSKANCSSEHNVASCLWQYWTMHAYARSRYSFLSRHALFWSSLVPLC